MVERIIRLGWICGVMCPFRRILLSIEDTQIVRDLMRIRVSPALGSSEYPGFNLEGVYVGSGASGLGKGSIEQDWIEMVEAEWKLSTFCVINFIRDFIIKVKTTLSTPIYHYPNFVGAKWFHLKSGKQVRFLCETQTLVRILFFALASLGGVK